VNFIEKFDKFFIALMEIRNSKITGFYNYEIKNNLEESYEKVLKTFVEQYHSELVSKYLTNISHSNNKESFVNYYNNKRA
jgi:hypothetical protein